MTLPSSTIETAAKHILDLQDPQAWTDWATQALVEGFDSPSLRILAGLTPPFDWPEIERLSSKALAGLKVTALTEEQALNVWVACLLKQMLAGQLDRFSALEKLKELHLIRHYEPRLRDFYLLFYALEELNNGSDQWYWDGANPDNIDRIIDDYAKVWLSKSATDTLS